MDQYGRGRYDYYPPPPPQPSDRRFNLGQPVPYTVDSGVTGRFYSAPPPPPASMPPMSYYPTMQPGRGPVDVRYYYDDNPGYAAPAPMPRTMMAPPSGQYIQPPSASGFREGEYYRVVGVQGMQSAPKPPTVRVVHEPYGY